MLPARSKDSSRVEFFRLIAVALAGRYGFVILEKRPGLAASSAAAFEVPPARTQRTARSFSIRFIAFLGGIWSLIAEPRSLRAAAQHLRESLSSGSVVIRAFPRAPSIVLRIQRPRCFAEPQW